MIRTFEKGSYLWSAERKGRAVTVWWGRKGGKMQSSTSREKDEHLAFERYARLIGEKREAGYEETTVWEPLPALDATGQGLELALVADPDDLSAHMAYADYLSEQPDERLRERAEFIRLQLQAEDEKLSAAERRKLTRRMKTLSEKHGHLWLGHELALFLIENETTDLNEEDAVRLGGRGAWNYRRGWPDELAVTVLTEAMARAMAGSPSLRLLRSLTVSNTPADEDAFAVLGKATNLTNVRDLDLDAEYELAGDVGALVRAMPRIERILIQGPDADLGGLFRLPTLTQLRELRVYGPAVPELGRLAKNPAAANLEMLEILPGGFMLGDPVTGPLVPGKEVRALFKSPHLKKLRRLQLCRSDLGNGGIRALVASGLLKTLTHLDLSYGCITDAGARALAASPDFGHLKSLDVSYNRLTEAGVRVLEREGLSLIAWLQDEADEDGEYGDEYLYEEDWE